MFSATYTLGRMTSRYPQDSNIIDFVEVKMLQLFEYYSAVSDHEAADACWNALVAYVDGIIDIEFIAGEPYVINRELADTFNPHTDDDIS